VLRGRATLQLGTGLTEQDWHQVHKTLAQAYLSIEDALPHEKRKWETRRYIALLFGIATVVAFHLQINLSWAARNLVMDTSYSNSSYPTGCIGTGHFNCFYYIELYSISARQNKLCHAWQNKFASTTHNRRTASRCHCYPCRIRLFPAGFTVQLFVAAGCRDFDY
jgi:hypothetical protein